jgi:hypothetical protein
VIASSPVSRVTNVRPCSSAVAAIKDSTPGSVRPAVSAREVITPHRSATAPSTGRTRFRNRTCTSCNHISSRVFLVEEGRLSIPRRISPRVKTLRKVCSSLTEPNQARTFASGCSLTGSEMTLVSRRKPVTVQPCAGNLCGAQDQSRNPPAGNSEKNPRGSLYSSTG